MAEREPVVTWAATYPVPHSNPETMTGEELLHLLRNCVAGKDYVLFDVRRTDIELMIKGSINIPAQTFFTAVPTLEHLIAGVPIVAGGCGCRREDPPHRRGPRCAGWLKDHLPPDSSTRTFVLEGGIVEWIEKYAEDNMDLIVRIPRASADADLPPPALSSRLQAALDAAGK